ncbi:MAG: cytochrome c oxidase subunit 3 [Planctomycetota bacterium]
MGGAAQAWDGRRDDAGGPPISTEKLGLLVLITSLAMLFVGLLSGHVIYKSSLPQWPPAGFPGIPHGIWVSTVVVVLSSAALIWADRAGRAGKLAGFRTGLALAALLAFAFLVAQAWLWGDCVRAGLKFKANLYGGMFFLATGLHAAHVLGGLGILVSAWIRSLRTADPATMRNRMELTGLYWHFVGALWLVLFTVLYLAE